MAILLNLVKIIMRKSGDAHLTHHVTLAMLIDIVICKLGYNESETSRSEPSQ